MRLARSTPSEQGVDPAAIDRLLDAVAENGIDLHSLMVLRHGQVVAEGWWTPYAADRVHLLYSLSKSFTSSAIGIAAGEGLLSLDDTIISFFPDKLPDEIPPYVADMKVRHLLAMASGHAKETAPALFAGGPDMVRTFLSIPPDQEPGTLFCYNQGCTYTLSAIITKLTGQRLVDYLRPRLFDPLGIDQTYWMQSDEGIDQGFSGLHVTTETIAKLGQLYLQNGQWNGQQLVPAAYVEEARTKHVDNAATSDNPDWQQGYGFQFWMGQHGAYRGDGAYGQFCVILPDVDAVIACTAQCSNMQAEIDLFWEHLLPALAAEATADPDGDQRIAQRLQHLSTATIDARAESPDNAVTFSLSGDAPEHLDELTAIRVEPSGRLVLIIGGADHTFEIRPGAWTEGELPGIQGLLPPVAITAGWTAADEFQADIVFLSAPHRLQLRAHDGAVATHWYEAPL